MAASVPKRFARGVLIVEAVVAAFLMIFAFAASTALFNAALQWEAQGANVRRAALVAEKKMGELRAWSQAAHSSAPFDSGWAPPRTGPQAEYPEAPGFAIEVIAGQPSYRVPAGVSRPPSGMYSPTSHFFAPVPAVPDLPNDFSNRQKDADYSSFPYVREFAASFRRVQVIVRYGGGHSREYRAVTIVGDPLVAARTASDLRISIARVDSASSNVSATNPGDYQATVTVAGHPVEDLVCLWSVDPLSSGQVIVKPKDASGRSARVFRPSLGNPGSTRLAVRLRYRGQEYSQFSDTINVI